MCFTEFLFRGVPRIVRTTPGDALHFSSALPQEDYMCVPGEAKSRPHRRSRGAEKDFGAFG